ncbi:GGDEF domain-containing protein [Dactylosporangium sucinum]|uniref:GGDEF domain-containing protein n=1 Tax=Dactylosporangium sucinum TaxID=1424081 RepID=UPI00167D641D|nr:GGDEF domain-containing protein [Dactylosporangium sucinum]
MTQLRTDALTGLPNRLGLEAEMERRQGTSYTLGLLDLDNFKAVNDRCGHEAGDDLLIEIADRLRWEVGANGFATRLHGDEFVVLLPAMTDDQAAMAAWEIKEGLAAPYELPGIFPYLQWASIGMTHAEPGEQDGDVLRRADVAMYRAKRGQIGITVFDPTLDVLPPREQARPQARPQVRLRDIAAVVTEPDGEVAA